jgi:hypothetical protein
MHPGADRIGGPGQEFAEPVGERGGQWRHPLGPGRIVGQEFGLQLQQPGPAIGTLEASRAGPVEIGPLDLDLLDREGVGEQGVDGGGLWDVRMQPAQGRQQP